MTTRVALIGANGHGLHHRKRLAELAELAEVELVGLCDVVEVIDPPVGVPLFTDSRRMLEAVRPEVVIVVTPPRTHLPHALAALEAGADVLVEKPPVLDLAEHETLAAAALRAGRVVQVGFQALASPDLARLKSLAPCDVSVFGSWQRDDGYWRRSPWAGRLPLDGALRNPFAHAVMQALAVAQSEPVRVEVAWCRTRDIDVDDTSTLRVTLADGHRILVAVTLAGEEFVDGEMTVGREHLTFRNFLGASLLENLLAHRNTGEPLLAPLSVTRPFTAVVQALRSMPRPGRLSQTHYTIDNGYRRIAGVNEALHRCAAEFALLNEIDTPWAATLTGGAATIG